MTLYDVVKKALCFTPAPTEDPALIITEKIEEFLREKFKDHVYSDVLFEEITGKKVSHEKS